MKLTISQYPGSFLIAEMSSSEKIITEKGAMIYCNGEYKQENKIEAGGLKTWIAKLLGKSFTYNMYTAPETLKFIFAPQNNAELFQIDVKQDVPILLEPDMHFARTIGLELQLEKQSWKSTLNDGLKLRTQGSGTLILQGYGNIIEHELNTEKPVYIDESALIAFEETLEVKTVSKGIKETLTSGEGFLFKATGKGKIWLQTREKGETSGGNFITSLVGI